MHRSAPQRSQSAAVPAFLFLPSGSVAGPALVFLRDGGAERDNDVETRATDLARAGYAVLVPSYGGPAVAEADPQVDPGEVQRVLDATRALSGHPRVIPSRIGILGTGHGGLVAMLAVMEAPKRFACVAQASGVVDVPRVASHVKIPVLLQHGWKDDVVEIGDAMYLGASLRRSGNSWARLKEYTLLGHDLWYWNNRVRYSADQVAQADWAWSDLLEFLDRHLRPRRPIGK